MLELCDDSAIFCRSSESEFSEIIFTGSFPAAICKLSSDLSTDFQPVSCLFLLDLSLCRNDITKNRTLPELI